MSVETRKTRSALANAVRSYGKNSPEAGEARREHTFVTVEEQIRAALAVRPELTHSQRVYLQNLLNEKIREVEPREEEEVLWSEKHGDFPIDPVQYRIDRDKRIKAEDAALKASEARYANGNRYPDTDKVDKKP